MRFRNYLTILLCCLSAAGLKAQTVQIGTGTSVPANTLYGPVYRYASTSTTTAARCNMVYTQAEMVAAGIPAGATITAVEFNKTNSANFVTPATFQMLMANTSNTALATTSTWASVLTTHTQVYSSTSFNMSLAAGWVTWTLATPFVYNGGALEIATDLSMAGNGGATDKFQWEYTATIPADRIVGVASAGATFNGTVAAYKYRPNIRITYTPPTVCTSPPTPGVAAASVTTTCANQPVQLTLSGNSVGSGQTYQWQSSPTATGTYTNIGTAGSISAFTVNPTATAHYRVAVTCGTSTTYSTPVQVLVNGGLAAGTYTINAAAAASTTNFQSFNAALAALNCGVAGPVVFNVVAGSGPYVEQLTLNEINGVSATNTITFNGNGNALSFAGVTGARAVINFNGADFVTFNDLIITATNASFAWGVHVTNNSDNNTINNCTINSAMTGTTAAAAVGIVMSGSATTAITVMPAGQDCDNNTFSNNTINGGYYGFSIVGSTTRSNGNKIINNTVKDFYYYGIKVDNQNDIQISGNDVSRPTRADVSIFYGINIDGSLKASVTRNRIHNPADADLTNVSTQYGIYISTSDAAVGNENIISNNLVYNFTRGGAQYGLYNSGSDNTWYFHNTIVLNDAAYVNALDARGIYQTTAATGLRFENNIVMVSRGGGGDNTVIYMNTPTTTYTSDRNIYIMGSTGAGVNRTGYFNSLTYATLLDWQIATSKDANSADVNPVFANPATGNFAPTNPDINNLALPVGVSVDILNVTRSSTTPDAGAYEFSPAACAATPTPGTASASITTICGGGYVTLNLTGNSAGAGQTYQWQRSTSSGGTYTNIGSAKNWAKYSISPTSTYYYRVAVKCGTNTQYSTSVRVSVSAAMPGGTYTINSAAPTGSGNFNSFTDAVDALGCGIAGPIIINVADGTYNEQIDIPVIFGSSATNRVTFQSVNGPANVTLQAASTAVADNYVVRLNGTSFLSFKGITVKNNGTTYARCIEIAGASSSDSVVNCIMTGATTTTSSNNTAKFFGDNLTGTGNVLQGCTVENGSYGVFISGTGTTNLVEGWTVQNNTVTDANNYSMYLYYTSNLKVRNNTISTTSTTTTHYCLYSYYGDNAIEITGNKITALTTGTKYGIHQYYSDGTSTNRGLVANNVVLVGNGTSAARGMNINYCSYQKYYNNTVNTISTSATTGYGAYFYFSSATTYTNNEIRNNVFSNTGGGYAMYVYNPSLADDNTWDYNNLYTSGAKLIDQGTPATEYTDLTAWRAAFKKDMNSISYDPGFINANSNLNPDPANPASWSVNGRGVQIAGNNKDINGNNRSVTLTGGVPDLGAYEFTPTVIPPAATAVPATPVQGGTQYFTFGQDTVASIKWSATGALPTTLAVRQYSGTLPPQLLSSSPNSYMYFYTHVDMPTTVYDYDANIYYKKPWLAAIANESNIKMIRKLGSSAWLPYNGTGSSNNVARSIITTPGVANPGYFTGILDDVLFFAFIYPGKRAFCPGGNAVLEANTGNNITYKWKLNGSYIPGATNINYTATAGGQYEVEETRNGAIVNSDVTTVNMVSPPAAIITTPGNPVMCVGGSLTLKANTGSGLTYQWQLNGSNIPQATADIFTANAIGTYNLEVTNPGCSTVSAPVTVTTQLMPMATINPSTDIPLCPGAAATLQMTIPPTGINNVTAQWRVDGLDIPGATGPVFNATMVGNYTVVLSSDNCPVTVSPGTNLLPAQVPFPVITANGQNLIVQSTFASYQWFRDGVAIAGATKFFYAPSQSGVYTVEVSNGGCTGLSADFTFIPLGIDDKNGTGQQIKIYPNPATSVVNIDAPAAVNITLTSVEGRTVADVKHAKQIDISALPKGVYIIKVMDGNGVLLHTQKLLKTSE